MSSWYQNVMNREREREIEKKRKREREREIDDRNLYYVERIYSMSLAA